MSGRPTTAEQPPVNERPAARRRNVGRVLGHIAVVIVVLAVIAGAFALSYNPMRDIARNAGVAGPLVRIYPGIFDAVFLVACAAALMLRDGRWWRRLYAWLSVLVTGALIAAADVYHATGLRLPRRIMDGTVAALPWALVLLGFSLWLSVLQQAKSGHAPQGPEEEDQRTPDAPVLALEATPAARAALPAPEPAQEAAAEPTVTAAEAEKAAAAPEAIDAEEAATAGEKTPAPEPRSAADDDTPAYGFPAVSAQNGRDQAPRTPSLLSAPVPEDEVDRGARGKLPAAAAELPGDEAEPAHEDRPAPDATTPEQPAPAEAPAPIRFERVRSTPTPPSQ